MLAMPKSLLPFCLGAISDTLPSPSNLRRWIIQNDLVIYAVKQCAQQLTLLVPEGCPSVGKIHLLP